MIYYIDKHDDVRLVWISTGNPKYHTLRLVRVIYLKNYILKGGMDCLTFEEFEKLL